MVFIVEVWVPSLDVNTETTKALWATLVADKRVENKKVSTQTIIKVAESKIFFGIQAKTLEDAFPIGYSALRQAWRSATDLKLRVIRITIHQSIDWTKPQEVDDGGQG